MADNNINVLDMVNKSRDDIAYNILDLEEIVDPSKKLDHAILLSGEGNCPPETVGDVHQYVQLLGELENNIPEAQMTLDELNGDRDFDPYFFDLESAKKRVRST